MAIPYLISHKPRRAQFRRPRRARPSGVVVVHTAESTPDTVGPDDGALNVARFIQGRTDPGSYHWLADSDSRLQLVPYDAEAYGDGTGSNPHAVHLSVATQAHRWPGLPKAWKDGAVLQLARAAAHYNRWRIEQGMTAIPARRITRAESERGVPGFISHGERDPGRRSDPGPAFPWSQFLAEYAALAERDLPAPPKPPAKAPTRVTEARRILTEALKKATGARAAKLRAALAKLPRR